MKIKKFNENTYLESIEDKRLERLRNLLTPLFTLVQISSDNSDGKFDDLIKKSLKTCKEVLPLIKVALKDNVTREELGQLYTDPSNRENI